MSSLDDSDSTVDDKARELRVLQKKELELLAELTALNESFAALSIPVSTHDPASGDARPTALPAWVNSSSNNDNNSTHTYTGIHRASSRSLRGRDPSTFDVSQFRVFGLRMRDKLSFRGEDKAREYFAMLDADHDGFIDYEECRAVHAFRSRFGFIEDSSHQSKEAWQVFMKNEGYALKNNKLSERDFVKYRVATEAEQSLLYELSLLGVDLVPRELRLWQHVNRVLDEVQSHRLVNKALTNADVQKLTGIFTIDEILYITANCNKPLTRPEALLLLFWRKQKANTMVELLRKYTKRHLSQKEHQFEIEKTASSPNVSPSQSQRKKLSRTRSLVMKARKGKEEEKEVLLGSTNEFALVTSVKESERTVSARDIDHVPVSQCRAWLLALPQLFDAKSLYRRILHGKYAFGRWARWCTEGSRFLFHFAGHLNDRLVFRDFLPLQKLSPYLQEISQTKFSIQIGGVGAGSQLRKGYAHQTDHDDHNDNDDGDNDDNDGLDGNVGGDGDEEAHSNGLSLHWKLVKIDNPEAAMSKLRVPTSCGSALSIDFLFSHNTPSTAEEQQRCAEMLKKYLQHHIERELKQNVSFTTLTCFATKNEYDESPVLRVVVAYKRLVSIDRFLEHQLLPFSLNDLLPVFVGDIKSSIDLHDFFTNKLNSLNDLFHVTMNCSIGCRKNLLTAIFERLILAMSSGMTAAQSQAVNPSSSSSVPFSSSVSSSFTASSSTKSTAAPTVVRSLGEGEEADDDTAAMRFTRWRKIFPFYSHIAEALQRVLDVTNCVRHASCKWQFNTLRDFVLRLPQIFGSDSFPVAFSAEQETLLLRPGHMRELYSQFKQRFEEEFGDLFQDLKTFLERRKEEEDRRRLQELISFEKKTDEAGETASAKKQNTLERMKRIGLEGKEVEDMLTNEAYEKNPLLYIHSQENEKRIGDATSLHLLEMICAHVQEVHSLELVTGKNKLSVQVHGLDFVKFIPKLPSMERVLHETLISKK